MPICPFPMVYVCVANGTFVLHSIQTVVGQSILKNARQKKDRTSADMIIYNLMKRY